MVVDCIHMTCFWYQNTVKKTYHAFGHGQLWLALATNGPITKPLFSSEMQSLHVNWIVVI